ncbi:uncharacterized protein Girdinl1 isoform X3 [Rattus norvegicus]|uniref:uncharacterized protein Girdinl1 isoform X3 n=1 Tax=Rattus norvegicus TaxID=10116 RepID=UPI002FD7A57F
MTAAGFPTETTASQCPRKKPRPALPGDLEAWSSRRPLARPPVWSPGTASSKQQAGRAAAPEQQNQGFGRKASSQNVISKQEECLKELEELKFEIQKCQFERDELYQILDLYIYDEWDHSIRHSQLLREKTQLKNNIQILLNEKSELLVEQTELPASSVEAKRLCEEAGMNIYDPRAKQQQV